MKKFVVTLLVTCMLFPGTVSAAANPEAIVVQENQQVQQPEASETEQTQPQAEGETEQTQPQAEGETEQAQPQTEGETEQVQPESQPITEEETELQQPEEEKEELQSEVEADVLTEEELLLEKKPEKEKLPVLEELPQTEESGEYRPIPEEYLLDAEGDDLQLESIGEQQNSDEIMVQAVQGHGTIFSDPTQESCTFSNKTKISLNFSLRSYGIDTDGYTVMIYKSGSTMPLAKKMGTFSATKGSSNYTFTWDTTNVSKYPAGTYVVTCFSTYETDKGAQLTDEYSYNVYLEDYKKVAARGFVTRLYQVVLGRNPDANGLKSWTDALYSGQKTGAQVTSQFVFSSEFVKKNLSDSAYVTVLYRAILGREPDTAGLNVWLNALNAGMTRWGVLKGFIASAEFTNICQSYSVTRGGIDTKEYRDMNAGTTSFVGRIYSVALGRKSDTAGLNYWTGRIINKQDSPAKVAKGFIFSKEFINKKLTNTQYISTLYKVLMNREADASGLNYWVGLLESGEKTREQVFNSIAGSPEFKSIIASYKL